MSEIEYPIKSTEKYITLAPSFLCWKIIFTLEIDIWLWHSKILNEKIRCLK